MRFEYSYFQTTTGCSAHCHHCPYADNRRFSNDAFTLTRLRSALNQASPNSVILLSGGEPLEAVDLPTIIQELELRGQWFRIATGGHIALDDRFDSLLSHPLLTGVSVSTDVIDPRSGNSDALRTIWRTNIKILNNRVIPYSLTITLIGRGTDMGTLDALADPLLTLRPQFVMVLVDRDTLVQEDYQGVKQKISTILPNVSVVINPIDHLR